VDVARERSRDGDGEEEKKKSAVAFFRIASSIAIGLAGT
jgi:hypothetical protein